MLSQIQTILIDDDPLIIEYLKSRLAKNSRIQIVGEAYTNCTGLELIQDLLPDLLILNIEMPGQSGFDLIRKLNTRQIRMPFVIFITAHPEFTLEALRCGAIDYLLKPIDEKEFNQAINRACDVITRSNQQHKIDFLHDYVSKYKQIFIPSTTGYQSISIKDIFYIRRNNEENRIELIFNESELIILPHNYSLTHLIGVLPKSDFFQIKRDILINIRYLSKIEVYKHSCVLEKGDFVVTLPMSRRSLKEFKDRMVI